MTLWLETPSPLLQARFIHIQRPRRSIDPIALHQLYGCSPQLFWQSGSHCVRTSPFRPSPPNLLYIVPIARRFLCHAAEPPALGTPYQLTETGVTQAHRKLTIDSLSHFWIGKDGELEKVDRAARR